MSEEIQWGFYFSCGPIIHMSSTGNAEAAFSRQPSAIRELFLASEAEARLLRSCSRIFGERVVESVEMLSVRDLNRQIPRDAC